MIKIFKKIGKIFVVLTHKDEEMLKRSVLIVDNGHSSYENLYSTVVKVQMQMAGSDISILTVEHRKFNLQKEFPTLNYIFLSQSLRPKRYQIALEMLKMREKKYDLIVLSSLDITPLIVALFFLKSKVILYNQWGQWWSLRLRNITEFFKNAYIKKKERFNFKNLLKRIGLFFVLLQHADEEILKPSILVVDNGDALYEHIGYAIQRIKEYLPCAKVSVLALEQRRELKDNFSDLEIIKPGKCIIEKYRIARHMLRLRKTRYDHIILLSLDITPIIVSILFMNSNILLNNQWHQWWSLKLKTLRHYLMVIPQFIFNIIINIIIFAYLLTSVSWIFFKKSFNVFRFNLIKRSFGNHGN